MILNRIMSAAAAAGAISACAAVAVVAAAFALYAVGRELVGEPVAAAILALIFALIAGVAAFVAYRGAKKGPAAAKHKHKQTAPPPATNMVDQAIALTRDHPLAAAGLAVAAGVLALRNPLIVTTLMSTLMQPRRPRP